MKYFIWIGAKYMKVFFLNEFEDYYNFGRTVYEFSIACHIRIYVRICIYMALNFLSNTDLPF